MFLKTFKRFLELFTKQSAQVVSLLFVASLTLTLLFSACTPKDSGSAPNTTKNAGSPGASKAAIVRIGYQKFTDLDVLRTRKNLEERLKPENVSVQWTLFQAGPPLMEAMNTGSIDIGGIGEVPPIFAQAAGAQVVYVSTKPAAPDTYGILIPKNSSIKSLSDLKGKKVALVKGSSAHYLLVEALKSAKLQFSDIQSTYLSAADARPAFEQGKIDAWVIWDPFLTVAQQTVGAKVLTTGKGLGENRGFHLASRTFAETNPQLVKAVQEELKKSEDWSQSHPKEIATQYAPQLGLDEPTLESVARRRSYGVLPIDDAVLAKQQAIADTFFQLKLIPNQIDVKKAAWKAA
jgi:sulfonate transport system substrate-binding protein